MCYCSRFSGQFGSAMSRIASDEHRFVHIKKGDKVLFLLIQFQGNEQQVYDGLSTYIWCGAEGFILMFKIGYMPLAMVVGDMLLLMSLVKQTFYPIGGTDSSSRHYLQLARKMNYEDKNVFYWDEGETVVFENGKGFGEKLSQKCVVWDALVWGCRWCHFTRSWNTFNWRGCYFSYCWLQI